MLYEKKCIWAVGVIRTYFYGWQVWTNSLIFFFSLSIAYLASQTLKTASIDYGCFPINKNLRFEISEIPRSQWNGTFRLHKRVPSHRAFGYCSCKQNTKERYWGQQFCQMERDISVRRTDMTRLVKEDHLQSWFRIFRSDQTEIVLSIKFTNQNFRNFGLIGKCPIPVV